MGEVCLRERETVTKKRKTDCESKDKDDGEKRKERQWSEAMISVHSSSLFLVLSLTPSLFNYFPDDTNFFSLFLSHSFSERVILSSPPREEVI